MKAWVYQDPKQVKKRGVEEASWYVGWFDPDGKKRCESCGPGAVGKSLAEKLRKKREAELITGTYQSAAKKTWAEFREEYEDKVVQGLAPRSRGEVKTALTNFERIVKPGRMNTIRTSTIDNFIAKRRKESGKKPGSVVSPATVNKDLRHLKAAMRKARRWGYLAAVPDFDMEKEPGKLPRYVTPEHFAALYDNCCHARMPADVANVDPADWWRGLLVFIYMTGWRIGAVLAMRTEDLDPDTGLALSRYDDNKGKRDAQIPLHPVVVEHLRRLRHFDVCVFPWNHDRTTLQNEFRRLQGAAGIKLPCRGDHTHTEACHAYGFHDLRRAFATMNADRMTGDALQHLMQHRSYATTQRYINMTRQLDEAVESLHVPDVLKKTALEG